MTKISFQHPEPERPKTRIWPVFMPFIGCPVRCVYCSQNRQTGTASKPLNKIYQDLKKETHAYFLENKRAPMEMAFFGGTFTALPIEWQERFLSYAKQLKQNGFITRIRCSTRPDCIDAALLSQLKACGLDMVELGIQSFDQHTLKRSARNYSPEAATKACHTVRQSGLDLVIQLLPGLPGSKEGDFQKDIDNTVLLNPEAVRIYPCLVIRGTALEKLYHAGKYTPWTLQQAEEELSEALLKLWKKKIQVIRIGVAQEEELLNNIVAGPYHPALGQSARSQALFKFISSKIEHLPQPLSKFTVPSRYSGEFWGQKKILTESYRHIGICPEIVKFTNNTFFSVL